jgi:uncharacterized protein
MRLSEEKGGKRDAAGDRHHVNLGRERGEEAGGAQWGYFGYFSDPDGYLWKVAAS